MPWISPARHSGDHWNDEALAYDEDTDTYAESSAIWPEGWSDTIQYFCDVILCDKIRFWADSAGGKLTPVRIRLLYSDAWHDFYEGAWSELYWHEIPLSPSQNVAGIQFEFYNSGSTNNVAKLHEVDFWEVEKGFAAGQEV